MLNVGKNNYHEVPKSSTVITPQRVVERIWDIIKESGIDISVVLDPAVGNGNLFNQINNQNIIIDGIDNLFINTIGVDISSSYQLTPMSQFICKKFEETVVKDYIDMPDLVICNPPFNGHPNRKLYPEIFLRHIVELFGDIPIVMVCPFTVRLNQRLKSVRWQWMRDNIEISSILSLPLDIFDNVLIQTEVLFFNFPKKIKAHYFL